MKRGTQISIVSLYLFFSACTERMTVDLDSSYPRLVVYGEITNTRKVHSIKLTRSVAYFSNSPAQAVSGANVSIFYDNNEFVLHENVNLPGVYQTNSSFAGISGKTYRLEIKNVDINEDGQMESYSASSYLPPVTRIDSIKLSYISNSFLTGWQVLLYALDPA
jgi:hypothetical protein